MSYTIQGGSFSTFNMQILSSSGALDIPKRLGETDYNWGDGYGVQAFAAAADLAWDGREIVLKAYYNGSDFIDDMDYLLSLKGTNQTLVTTFGTHTVRLLGSKVISVFKPNEKLILEISFFESTVPVSAPGAITGGSGISIGGYDFVNDFGLHVKSLSGFGDISEFSPRELSYGDTAKIPSAYYRNRNLTLELNGKYMTLAALISSVNKFRYVLQSQYTKQLVYRGVTRSVYFTDGAKIEANPMTLHASMKLNLKIEE